MKIPLPSYHSNILAVACGLLLGVGSSHAQSLDAPPLVGSVETTIDEALANGALMEEQPNGAYGQPDWVSARRFSLTRVYIQRNPGEIAVEQWWRSRVKDGVWKHRFQEEVEIGLPGRMQLDLYGDWTYQDGSAEYLDFAAEIRYGLADWGVLPGNPALYFEYKWTDPGRGGDVIEPKLLFGGEFGKGWHWGLNLVYERELGGENTEEYQISEGLSKTLIDEVLSLGLEAKYTYETIENNRADAEHKVQVGPSLQWRPTRNTHLDLVGLGGVTKDSPDFEGWVVFGIDFGSGGSKKAHAPVSGRR